MKQCHSRDKRFMIMESFFEIKIGLVGEKDSPDSTNPPPFIACRETHKGKPLS